MKTKSLTSYLLLAVVLLITTAMSQAQTGPVITTSKTVICGLESATLSIDAAPPAGAAWCWYASGCGGTQLAQGASITVSPTTTTTYYARSEEAGGSNPGLCGSITIPVRPKLLMTLGPDKNTYVGYNDYDIYPLIRMNDWNTGYPCQQWVDFTYVYTPSRATLPGETYYVHSTGTACNSWLNARVAYLSNVTVTLNMTDGHGCTATDEILIMGMDVRCTMKNGSQGVKICHMTGRTSKPCEQQCVAFNKVADHLAHGDYLGPCLPACGAKAGEDEAGEEFNVFPNPASTVLNIVLPSDPETETVVEICNMDGKRVMSARLNPTDGEEQHSIDISKLANGLYMARYFSGGTYETKRFAVIH